MFSPFLPTRNAKSHPKFKHAARAMKRSRHAAFPIEFSNVSQVYKYDVVTVVKRERLLDGHCLDLALRRLDQCTNVHCDLLNHHHLR